MFHWPMNPDFTTLVLRPNLSERILLKNTFLISETISCYSDSLVLFSRTILHGLLNSYTKDILYFPHTSWLVKCLLIVFLLIFMFKAASLIEKKLKLSCVSILVNTIFFTLSLNIKISHTLANFCSNLLYEVMKKVWNLIFSNAFWLCIIVQV